MGCRSGWLRSASNRSAVSQHDGQLAVGSPCGVASFVCSIRPSSVPEATVQRVMLMRFLLAAVALSILAHLPSAEAGLRSALNTSLEQSGAPSVHINSVTGEARFVRLQAPTELTLESATGALAPPSEEYPAGIAVDLSGLPYRLYWRSEQPFEATFDAGRVFVPLLMSDAMSNSSFKYWPPPLSHDQQIGTGGVAVVAPEPAGLCLAIGGLALLAARARRG